MSKYGPLSGAVSSAMASEIANALVSGAQQAASWVFTNQPGDVMFGPKRKGRAKYTGLTKYKRRGRKRYRRGRKRRFRKRRKRMASVRSNQRYIRKVARRVEAGMGTFVWKKHSTAVWTCSADGSSHNNAIGSDKARIESAIDALPVYDPATGTSTPRDFTAGSLQKQVEIAKTKTQITVRNNYLKPVKVCVYLCIPKSDTNTRPTTAITQGLADIGAPSGNALGLYANLVPQFRDFWAIMKTKKRTLQPGQTVSLFNQFGSFLYDPSFVDSHNLAYQRKYGAHEWLVRLEGVPSHGATSGSGTGDGSVDVTTYTMYTVKYEAGADIFNYEDDNGFNQVGSSTVGLKEVESNNAL